MYMENNGGYRKVSNKLHYDQNLKSKWKDARAN